MRKYHYFAFNLRKKVHIGGWLFVFDSTNFRRSVLYQNWTSRIIWAYVFGSPLFHLLITFLIMREDISFALSYWLHLLLCLMTAIFLLAIYSYFDNCVKMVPQLRALDRFLPIGILKVSFSLLLMLLPIFSSHRYLKDLGKWERNTFMINFLMCIINTTLCFIVKRMFKPYSMSRFESQVGVGLLPTI